MCDPNHSPPSADPATLESGPTAFSHLDSGGRARMVDVSSKAITRRVARASCRVLLAAETVARLESMPKGDAITVARIAGIQAAKRVDSVVPMAHSLALDHVEIEIEPFPAGASAIGDASLEGAETGVSIACEVVCTARTGAELEALGGCAAAALTLYDMVKAVEKGAVITALQLEQKSGGRGGDWTRDRSQAGERA